MTEPAARNTYSIPTSSQEVSIVSTPEISRARQEALQYAADAQPANPDDFDRRRVEGFGASTLSAAAAPAAAEVHVANEAWCEDTRVLTMFGRGVVRYRTDALHGQDAA